MWSQVQPLAEVPIVASPLPFRVIPCAEWGAAPPKGAIARTGKPGRTIFHHTAGHVPNLSAGETYAEACAYARVIQQGHFRNGWVDTGNNYLITRGGFILEGRHGSHAAVLSGHMVVSAHCPGQNDQPGIEHEHNGTEQMSPIQREASVWLHALICKSTGIIPSNIQPHKRYFATACPGNLAAALPGFRKDVAAALAPAPEAWWAPYVPTGKANQRKFFAALREAQRRYS